MLIQSENLKMRDGMYKAEPQEICLDKLSLFYILATTQTMDLQPAVTGHWLLVSSNRGASLSLSVIVFGKMPVGARPAYNCTNPKKITRFVSRVS